MSLKQTFAVGVAWSLVGAWAREAINLLLFLALARLLGPRVYGLIGMTNVAIAFAYALLIDSLSRFIVREKTIEQGHVDAVFWLQTLLAVALSIGMLVVAAPLAALYGEPLVAEILRALAVLPFLYNFVSVPSALLLRDMRFPLLTIRSFAGAVVGGMVGVGFALAGAGVWSLVLMSISQYLVQISCLWGTTRWRPGLTMRRHHICAVIRFGKDAVGVNLLVLVDQQLPRFVIATWLGATALGYFTMAWRIVEVMSTLAIRPVSDVAAPAFSTIQDQSGAITKALGSVLELSTFISAPCFLGLWAIAPVLVPVAFGAQWEGAVTILQFTSLFGVAWALSLTLDAVIVARGMMAWRTRFILGSVLAMVVLMAATYHSTLQVIGAAMAVREIGFCAAYLIGVYAAGISDWRTLLAGNSRLFLAALLMAAAVVAWRTALAAKLDGLLLVGSAVIVGVAAYSIALGLVARSVTASLIAAARQMLSARWAAAWSPAKTQGSAKTV